jgi:stage IV sporulation protein FB
MNLFKIKIKNTTYGVSFSFFFVAAVFSICSNTQADELLVTLMCCAFHELGHLVLMTAFGSSPQEIVVYGGGIRITPDNKQLSKYHELAVLFAGPAVNFMLCLLSYLTSGGGFFCQVNFLLGVLNLLPFRYFDGGRVLALIANGKVCEFFRAVFILLSAVAMVYMILHGTVSVSFATTFCFIVLSEVIY